MDSEKMGNINIGGTRLPEREFGYVFDYSNAMWGTPWPDMLAWCQNQWGEEPPLEQDPVVYFVARWYTLTGRICIRDKTDYIWFMLKWGEYVHT